MSASAQLRLAGVDVGGTWTDAVVVGAGGGVLGRARIPTDSADGGRVLGGLAQAVSDALDAAGAHPADLQALGVGMPGQVDPVTGVVRLAMNLRIDERGIAVCPELEKRLGVSITLENDVRAAAIGAFQYLRPTHPELSSLAYLSIGTGLSAGFVVNGRLHRGRDGMAGEIGHVIVDENGPLCRCGLHGCLEAVAAGPAIRALWPSANGRPAADLFAAAESGDPAAVSVADTLTGHWVRAIQWLGAACAADLVAVGGGVGSTGGPLLARVRERLEEMCAASGLARRMLPPERVVAMPAELPVGALGAAALARDRWEEEMGVAPNEGIGITEGRRG